MYGSSMHLLVHHVMPDTPEKNLKIVWAEAGVIYDELGIHRTNRFTQIHASMFKAMHFPV